MSRIVFIESNTTGTGMQALRKARDLGLRPGFVTRSPERYAGLDKDVDLLVCNTNDTAALARTIAWHWPTDVVGVTTTSDFYLGAVAAVAAELGLPGNTPETMAACRDKAEVRRIFARSGVPQPNFAVVSSAEEVAVAVSGIGLPCVVKPLDGSGSQHVKLCEDVGEARHHVEDILATRTNVRGQPTPDSVLLEEFVEGAEFSVETFSHDHTVTCLGVTAKTLGPPPSFVEARHVYPAPVPSAVSAELTTVVERALKALGFEQGPAHTEVRWGPAGPVVIEVNGRLAGGMIPEIVRLVEGVDLVTEQIKAAVGLRVDLSTRRRGAAGIRFLSVAEHGVLRGFSGADRASSVRGVSLVQITAGIGDRVGPPRDAYGRLGYVIAHRDSAAAVERALDRAVAEIAWEVEPE